MADLQEYSKLYGTGIDKAAFINMMITEYKASHTHAKQVYDWCRTWHGDETQSVFYKYFQMWRASPSTFDDDCAKLQMAPAKILMYKSTFNRFAGTTDTPELRKTFLMWFETRDSSSFKETYGAPNASWMINTFKAIVGDDTCTSGYKQAWELILKCGSVLNVGDQERLIDDVTKLGFSAKYSKDLISRFRTAAGIKTNFYRVRISKSNIICRKVYEDNPKATPAELQKLMVAEGVDENSVRKFISVARLINT